MLLGGPSTIDYFIEKGILQFTSRNLVKFTFVGAIVANKKVVYVSPKFASFNPENKDIDQSYYIKVIKKYVEYSARKSARKPVQEYLENVSLLMRTFDSLDYYFQKYGIFKEKLAVFAKEDRGRINWARTIQDMMPVHVTSQTDGGISRLASASESVFYPFPIQHSMSQQDGIISLIFRSVLTLLATIITPLLERPHPLCLRMGQDSITALLLQIQERRPYYTRIVAQQISREFGHRRTVLSSLLAFLRAEASVLDGAIRNKAFAFGVKRFSSIWEDACVRAVGGERGSHQLAKITWRPRHGKGGDYQSRIDAKISSGDGSHVTLVDAKYYLVNDLEIDGLENVEKFIPSYDIVKQFGYVLAYHMGTSSSLDIIDSAFICPQPSKSNYTYIGKISYEHFSDAKLVDKVYLCPINVYGIDPKYLFDAYIQDRLLQPFISFLDADHNIIEKIAFIKRQRNPFNVRMRKDESGIKIITAEGQSKIPWMDGNQIARVKSRVKDLGILRILDDMQRKRNNRDSSGYVIKNDVFIEDFDLARFLLGGDNPKTRNSVEIQNVLAL